MILETYRMFGFDDSRSTSPPVPRTGSATTPSGTVPRRALQAALDAGTASRSALNPGDGAFYGPKIDFIVEDALSGDVAARHDPARLLLPERFDLRYTAPTDRGSPVMIHRAMLGSLERFIGILIEHCAGAFPFWLAPVQVRVLSITDAHADRAREVVLAAHGRRVAGGGRLLEPQDRGQDPRGAGRTGPVFLVIGDREVADGTVSVRERREGDLGAMRWRRFSSGSGSGWPTGDEAGGIRKVRWMMMEVYGRT